MGGRLSGLEMVIHLFIRFDAMKNWTRQSRFAGICFRP